MEISSVDFDSPVSLPVEEPETLEWEKWGRRGSIGFSIIACAAFIPAAVKKQRRTFSVLPSNLVPIPLCIAEPEDESNPIAPRCTPGQQKKVEEIFHTVAQSAWYTLALSSSRLMTLGREIDPIHPFSFLMAAPKEQVRAIFTENSSLKVAAVMQGITKGMEREYANLDGYIPDFANAFNKDEETVRQLIQERSWRPLVEYLFEINARHEG